MHTDTHKKSYRFNRLQPRTDWSFRHVGRKETNSYTHGYHRYPAKFIPQIVRKLIQKFAPKGNEIICDPFGGLVEAKISGRESIGFDINPIAKLITQVKVSNISPELLEKSREEFLKNYEKSNAKKNRHSDRVKYWFKAITIKELDRIYFAIIKIKNPKVKKFFLCAFSHNLKNCSRWLMKSIKPTIDKNKKIANPKDSFLRHLDTMIRKNKQFHDQLEESGNSKVKAAMFKRDSTKRLPRANNSVDLIITSPPYVTSYEYADLHQLSLLWYGDDKKNFKKWNKFSKEFNNFRRQFIGTSIKGTMRKTKPGSINIDSATAQKIISKLELVDKPLAADVKNYFFSMQKVFKEMYRILKKGGMACVIVGNTNLRDTEILNAEVAAEQMSKIGFRKTDFIKREVLNKMITPWRDEKTGKFTGLDNPDKKRVYQFEYIVVMEKVSNV